MRIPKFVRITGLLTLLAAAAAPASAQSLEQEVRTMRAELERLRLEVDALKAEIGRRPAEDAGAAQAAPGVEAIPMLQSQIAEQAQTKVESASRFPVKIFGTVVSNTFMNTSEANWQDLGNVAVPYAAGFGGSFSTSVRQTRIGANVSGPSIGNVRTSGAIIMDFFGGIPNFATGQTMPLPRLLYGFFRAETDTTAVEAGQDRMILAPKDPTSLAGFSFPLLFRSGNLYLRVPQVRIERRFATGGGEFEAMGGITAPIAGDFTGSAFEFVPPNLAGERSRTPGSQARLAWRTTTRNADNLPTFEIGASGHYSEEKFLSGTQPSRAGSIDVEFNLGRIGATGEFFLGQNIDAFGGTVGQIGRSRGGFVEGRLGLTSKLSFNGGYGIDKAVEKGRFNLNLVRNSSVYSNLIFRFTPELAGSIEHRWLETLPARGLSRRNNHFNLTFAYSF